MFHDLYWMFEIVTYQIDWHKTYSRFFFSLYTIVKQIIILTSCDQC